MSFTEVAFLSMLFLYPGTQNQPVGSAPGDRILVFENCQILTMKDQKIQPDGAVIVEGTRIKKVGSTGTLKVPREAKRINCNGVTLMPGLTDMHVHLGHPSELLSYLLSGVTTVTNLGGDYLDLFSGRSMDILALRTEVERGRRIGPTIYSAGQALDGDPATGPFQRALSSEKAAVEAVREQKEKGFHFIKVYDGLSQNLHTAIVKEAKKQGLAVFGHIPESMGVQATLISGQQVIAHGEEFYQAFEDSVSQEQIIRELADSVAKSNVYVIPNTAFVRSIILQLKDLESQLARPEVKYLAPRIRRWWEPRYNFYTNRNNPEAFLRDMQAKYQWLIPLIREFQRRGIPLLAGSDANVPGALPGLSLIDELRDLIKAGLSPYQALVTATKQPGRFFRETMPKETPFGTIEIGYRADFILVEGNPLDSIEALKKIKGVMVGGKWFETPVLRQKLAEAVSEFNP